MAQQEKEHAVEPPDDLFFKYFENGHKLSKHIEQLIKSRTMNVIGDETHLSVRRMMKSYEEVDRPRDYNFQDKDVYEQDALRYFKPELGGLIEQSADDVIAGKAEARLTTQYRTCSDCNEPLYLHVRGNTVEIKGDGPCQSSGKFDVEIHFPTGRVIVADWPVGFTDWFHSRASDAAKAKFPDMEEVLDDCERYSQSKIPHELTNEDLLDHGPSINYLKGIRVRSERYANMNIAHFFVGNSCPAVIQTPSGQLSIHPDTKDSKGTALTSICTDLWWATMIDEQYWREFMTDAGMSKEDQDTMLADDATIIDIKPGYWKFTSRSITNRRINARWKRS